MHCPADGKAADTANPGHGTHSIIPYKPQCLRQCIGMQYNQIQTRGNIKHGNHRNRNFIKPHDKISLSEYDPGNKKRHDEPYAPGRYGNIRCDRMCNRICRCDIPDTKGCKNTKHGKQNTEKAHMAAVLQCCHRSADKGAIPFPRTIMDGKHNLCIFGHHAEDGTDAHPQQCTRPSHRQSRGNAHHTADSQCSSQCGRYSLKGSNPVPLITFSQ